MNNKQIFQLVSSIEDAISFRVDIDIYEEILPKIATVLYNRYCLNELNSIDRQKLLNEIKQLEELV